MQEVDWGDFRDHLATADKDGRRRWIYPRQTARAAFTARALTLSWLLLAIMFAGPLSASTAIRC